MTAVAAIRRESVSAANSLTRPPRKTPPMRDKMDSPSRRKLLQYQLLITWLGRKDSNVGIPSFYLIESAENFWRFGIWANRTDEGDER